MLDIQKECDLILDELYKFSDDVLHLGLPITDDRLEKLEKEIGFNLPFDFKYLLRKHNGISLMGTEILGVDKELLRGSSLDEVNTFEHIADSTLPAWFLPFSPDGRGNHYCLDLSKYEDGLCPVVFWQYDFAYESVDDVEVCNLNIMDWVKEVVID
jgi:cell wall assembly regulator SMI1